MGKKRKLTVMSKHIFKSLSLIHGIALIYCRNKCQLLKSKLKKTKKFRFTHTHIHTNANRLRKTTKQYQSMLYSIL